MFDLNQDPGSGNLNLRGYIASIVGPRRIAHGMRKVMVLTPEKVVQVASHSPQGPEVAYVEIWLPEQSIKSIAGEGAFIAISSGENAGQNAFQVELTATQRFAAILLPNDQLFAQLVRAGDGSVLDKVSIVRSSVVF